MTTVLDEVNKQIPELDWFAFETKMRKVIHKLVQPPIAFVKELSIDIKKENDAMKQKIEEFETMLFSTDKHLSINDLRSQLTKNKEIKVIEQLENNAKKLDEMEVSLENGHKQHTMILDEVNSFGKQLNSMNDSLKVLEQSVTDQITKTLRGYNEEMLSVKNQLMQIDQKLIITGEELITHFGQFEMLRRDIDNFKTDYNIYREITIKIEEGGIMKNDYLKDITLIREDINRIRFGLEDLSSNLMTTDNYLDKYLPFRIQNFISETLENVLPEDQLELLIEFEKVKYKHIHQKVLVDEGISNMKKSFPDLKETYRKALEDSSMLEAGSNKSTSEQNYLNSNENNTLKNKRQINAKTDKKNTPASRIKTKTSKLKDLLIMATSAPYQYFKEQDSATLRCKESSALHKVSNASSRTSPIQEKPNESDENEEKEDIPIVPQLTITPIASASKTMEVKQTNTKDKKISKTKSEVSFTDTIRSIADDLPLLTERSVEDSDEDANITSK